MVRRKLSRKSHSKRKTLSKRGSRRHLKGSRRHHRVRKTRGGYIEPGWVYDSQYGKWRNTKNGWCKWSPDDSSLVDCKSSLRSWRDGKSV